jgi:hypothetical protein
MLVIIIRLLNVSHVSIGTLGEVKIFSQCHVEIRIIKSRKMRWAEHVARMGEKRNAHRLLVGKPEGKRPLERPRRRWVDNIRMDVGKVEWGDVDWIGLAQDSNKSRALVN